MPREVGVLKETLVERFVGLVPVPYFVASVFLVLITTFLGSMYVDYSDFHDLGKAFTSSLAGFQDLGFLLFRATIVYVLYAPHFMRRRLIEALPSVVPLLPNGEEGFQRMFPVSAVRPQLIILGLVYSATLLSLVLPRGSPEFTPLLASGGFVLAIFFLVTTLGVSSTLWTYLSSLRGIRRMATAPLRLLPYYKDRFLGLKVVGSLALSLAIAYFVFVGIISITTLSTPQPLVNFFLLLVLIVLGLLMFFLPLNQVHNLMVHQKAVERAKLEQNLDDLYRDLSQAGPQGDPGRLFFSLSISAMMRKEASSIANWPFDTSVLAKLTIIVLSVTATLLARYIATFLHI